MRCSSASTPETLSRREETFPSRFLQCFQWLIHAKSFYNCASGQGLGPVARAFHTPGGRLAGNFTALQPHFLAASLRKPCSFLQDGRQSPGHVRLDLPPAHLAIDALQLGEHARNVVETRRNVSVPIFAMFSMVDPCEVLLQLCLWTGFRPRSARVPYTGRALSGEFHRPPAPLFGRLVAKALFLPSGWPPVARPRKARSPPCAPRDRCVAARRARQKRCRAKREDRWHRELFASASEECIGADHKPFRPMLDQSGEDDVEVAFSAGVQDVELKPKRAGRPLRVSRRNLGIAGLVGLTRRPM